MLEVNEQGLSNTRVKLLSIETKIKILTDSEQFLETAQKNYEHREWQQKLLILLEDKENLYKKKVEESSKSLLFCSLNTEAESYDNTLKSENLAKYQVITNLLDQMNSKGLDALMHNLVIMSGRPKQSIDSGIINYIIENLPNCQVIGLENERDRARALNAPSHKPQPYSLKLIELMMNQIARPEEEKVDVFESFKTRTAEELGKLGIDSEVAIRNRAWFDSKLEAGTKSAVKSAENIIIVVGDDHAQKFYGILAKIKGLYREATIAILDSDGITHPYDHINATHLIQEVSGAAAASGESLSASENSAEFEAQADLVPPLESDAGSVSQAAPGVEAGGLVKLDFDTH